MQTPVSLQALRCLLDRLCNVVELMSSFGWRHLTDENRYQIFNMLGFDTLWSEDTDLHCLVLWDKATRDMLSPHTRWVFCGACHAQRHLYCAPTCYHFRMERRCFTCWQPLGSLVSRDGQWWPPTIWAMVAPRGIWSREISDMVAFRLAFQRCSTCDLPPQVPTATRYRAIVEEGGPRPLYGYYQPVRPLELQEARLDLSRRWLHRDVSWEDTLEA